MSMNLGGGGLTTKRQAFQQNAEINITPFVDVMLVLPIIFMVAAPIATVSVPVELPPANPRSAPKPPTRPVYISVQKDGAVSIGEHHTDLEHVASILRDQTNNDPTQQVFLICLPRFSFRLNRSQ